MFDVSGGVRLHFDNRMLCMRIVRDMGLCRLCQFGFFGSGIVLRISPRTKRFDVTLRQNVNSPSFVLGAVKYTRIGLAVGTAPARGQLVLTRTRERR